MAFHRLITATVCDVMDQCVKGVIYINVNANTIWFYMDHHPKKLKATVIFAMPVSWLFRLLFL